MATKDPAWTDEDTDRAKVENRGLNTTEYVRGCRLGLGGWSVVFKIRRVSDGQVFAGKSFKTIKDARKEVEALKLLRHEHIVKFIELYHDAFSEASTLLVMELCSYGTLQTRIDQATPHMAHGEILRTTRQIAQALEYMHALKLYHSDVKPRNILIRALHPIDAVLADCADVKEFGRRGKLQGTPAYWSPEMRARNMHCGPADDVWALGITLLGMVGQWPQMMYSKRDLEKYPERCFEHVCKLDELNPAVGVVGLLRHLLVKEAWERMSAADCVRGARELEERQSEVELEIRSPAEFRPISFW